MNFQFYNDKTENDSCLFVCSRENDPDCDYWFTRTFLQLILEKKNMTL
jgi:hypothetical protein